MDAIKSVGAEGKFTYIFDLAYPIVIYQGAPSEDGESEIGIEIIIPSSRGCEKDDKNVIILFPYLYF